MPIQIQGNTGTVAEVETSTRATRTTPRPIDVGALGSYAIDTVTGTMAAGLAAASPVYSFRWGNVSNLALIRAVRVSMNSLTAFTAGVGLFELVVARNFTTSDTGGVSVLPVGDSQKRRTTFGTTLITDLRQSTTATLVAGVRTLDTRPLSTVSFTVPVTAIANHLPMSVLWLPDFSGEWPLVLTQDEGFIIRATVPATGTWTMHANVEWCEITSF